MGLADFLNQKPAEAAPATEPVNLKPAWMSDDDYNAAVQSYSPERISQLYGNFDPNSAGSFYQEVYKAVRKTPSLPDENKLRASRSIASAVDGLSLLAQGITGATGGYIPQSNTSAQRENEAYIQRLKDMYRVDRDRFDTGLYQSVVKDIEDARLGHNRDKSGLLGVIQNARSLKNTKEIADTRNATDLYKFGEGQRFKEDGAKETVRHNKEMEGIAAKNAASNAVRAAKTSAGGASLKGMLEFFDPSTGSTYKVNEKKFNANAPQMFNILKEDILSSDDKLKRQYQRSKGKITLQEQNDAVKKYMLQNPDAVKFLEKISVDVVDDSPLVEPPEITQDQYSTIEKIVNDSKGNDEQSLRSIALYLKEQGYNQIDIKNTLKSIQ